MLDPQVVEVVEVGFLFNFHQTDHPFHQVPVYTKEKKQLLFLPYQK